MLQRQSVDQRTHLASARKMVIWIEHAAILLGLFIFLAAHATSIAYAAEDTPIEELVILQYLEEEGWVEVPLEESLNGQIEALAESGGVFVLAQGAGTAEGATADQA